MTEQEQAYNSFSGAGIIDALTWAAQSTNRQVLADHPPEAGYTNITIGNAAYDLIIDRLDRVFQCGRYQPDPNAPEGGRDVLHEEIHTDERLGSRIMPAGVVVRDDMNNSAGWRFQQWRWLRASFEFGQVDEIRWPDKGATKQRVARRLYVGPDSLFSEEELRGTAAVSDLETGPTLVLAHSLDTTTEDTQVFLGRPRWNSDSGPAWHWRIDLLGRSSGGAGGVDATPFAPLLPSAPFEVADAPVRLRPAGSAPGKRSRERG